LQRIRVKNPLVLLEEGKFFKLKDIEIFVEKVLSKKNMVRNISIHRLLNPEIFIFAKQGKLYLEDKKIIFDLFDGLMHKPLLNAPEKYYVIKFKTYKLIQNFDEESRKREVIKGIRELNFLELLNSMKKYKELDINTSSIKFELSKRIALCISNLIFIFLGSILAMVGLRRTTKGLAFGITVLIIIVYYLLLVFSQIIGERGLLNPIFCGFIPNIFLLFPIILLLPKFFRL
jgi:lipopolysaccharide export LptBFGC system permease protein LptF